MWWSYPLFLYVCLTLLLPVSYAIYITTAITFAFTVFRKYHHPNRILSRATLGMNAIFLSSCLLCLFTFPRGYEVFKYLLVDHLLLIFVFLFKPNPNYQEEDESLKKELTVTFLRYYRDSQHFLSLIKVSFIVLLIISYIYLLGFKYDHTPDLHAIFLVYLRAGVVCAIGLIMVIRFGLIEKRLEAEVWLPIINEQAKVIGKIAQTVSVQLKEKYLHPRVRVLVFQKGMVFMRKINKNEALSGVCFDTPVAQDLYFKQGFEECVSALQNKNGMEQMPKAKYLSRYLYEDKGVRRMMFLYTLYVPDDVSMHALKQDGGKFWSEKEIELNLGKGVFSKYFEEEYALLKSTVFPVMKIMSKDV